MPACPRVDGAALVKARPTFLTILRHASVAINRRRAVEDGLHGSLLLGLGPDRDNRAVATNRLGVVVGFIVVMAP